VPQIGPINPGWFLLICGLIVLAAGLILLLLARQDAPERSYMAAPVSIIQPVRYAPAPVYTLQPTASPASRTPSSILASPPPEQLRIELPVCYDTPHQNVMCLGRVFNLTDTIIDSVRLRVEMQANGGSAFAQPEQRFITPGSFAPYRVQFNQAVEERAALTASLEFAHPRLKNSYLLAVINEEGEPGSHENGDSGRYVVTATVLNPYQRPVRDIQIIGTVSDSQGKLTGYRVETLPGSMSAGESRPLRLEIIPQTLDDAYTHHLTVLAWGE
jgi:hypothetical protein